MGKSSRAKYIKGLSDCSEKAAKDLYAAIGKFYMDSIIKGIKNKGK